MELNVVSMPKDEALEKFHLYQDAVRRSRDAADRLLARAYKAMSEGHGILNLKEVLAKGGVDERTWLPKLAVMRADQPMVYFKRVWDFNGRYSYSERHYLSSNVRKAQAARLQFVAPENSFPRLPEGMRQPQNYWSVLSAPVPPIPPEFRPADALSKYCILWEVDEWSPVQPPDDPILLRPLGGDLYAVMAMWNLTDAEKLVLGAILGA